ncbi:MAG: arylsulfatase [FCB group bacterium]|nr:arylsulfatase [FCB group bacterium]MBL7120379.1 arylsulfatase [Candidatus Neomarinimicrobiota bacterium]
MERREFLKIAGRTLAMAAVPSLLAGKSMQPNVILILTDDQGYGELGCTGNTVIKTPFLDQMYAESSRLNDFHVNSVCSPSRAAILSGKYSSHVGIWHTVGGREILNRDETLMPQLFQANGYRTQMVGKWHLGDNYPYRPEDRGFDEVFRIGGGSPGQVPDYWGNGIFDLHYWNGKKWRPSKGFCTDVQFDATMKFIKDSGKNPFFCYLATTAVHAPIGAPDEYLEMYKDLPEPVQKFYAMTTNVDTNVGRLRKFLKQNKLDDNTILIFMTDNGSACDKKDKYKLHNGGMRGKKGSTYDGGHRVPCFIHWPAGGISRGMDIEELTAHIDLLPTLMDACGLERGPEIQSDGRSLLELLKGKSKTWSDRTLVTESKVKKRAEMYASAAIMTEQWRLVDKGRQLYDIEKDPGQKQDLATSHPQIVEQLQTDYQSWYQSVEEGFSPINRIVVGAPEENPTRLTCMDVYPVEGANAGKIVWNQSQLLKGNRNHGRWLLEVAKTGEYEFELRRWPVESGLKFSQAPRKAKKVIYTEAHLKIGDREQRRPVDMNESSVKFSMKLDQGPLELEALLFEKGGEITSAYYVEILKKH